MSEIQRLHETIEKLNRIIDELREQKEELQNVLMASEKNYVSKNAQLQRELDNVRYNSDRLEALIKINTELREHLNLVSGESIMGAIKKLQYEYAHLKKNADNMDIFLHNLDVRGGLGFDVHDKIKQLLDNYKAV